MSKPPNINLIVLSGTHGAGKTTIIKTVSERLDVPFIESDAGQIHKDFGYEGGEENVPFQDRIHIQGKILSSWIKRFEEAEINGGVFDRCPIDFAAYLLSEVGRKYIHFDTIAVSQYLAACKNFAQMCNPLFFVWPHDSAVFERDASKPDTANAIYSSKIHFLIQGLLISWNIPFWNVRPGNETSRVETVMMLIDAMADQQIVKAAMENNMRWQTPGKQSH